MFSRSSLLLLMEDTLRQEPLSCVSAGDTILICFISEPSLLNMNVYEKVLFLFYEAMRGKNKIDNKDEEKITE